MKQKHLEKPCLSCGCLYLAAAALVALPLLASAGQEVTRWDVRERPRPAYDSVGIRAGGFLIFPSMEVDASNNDNIYKEDQGENSDRVFSLRPRIFGASQWSNHELNFDAGVDSRSFSRESREDALNWFAGVEGRLDVARDFHFRAAVNARRLHEDRGDPNSPRAAKRPVSRNLLSAEVGAFRRMNRLNLQFEGKFADVAYDNATDARTGMRVVQNDRNRKEAEIGARIGWEITPGYEAFVRAKHYARRYTRLQKGFDRDSDGSEFVAGAALDLGSVFSGELFLGYREQEFEDFRLPSAEGLSFGASLTWNPTALTTVWGMAEHSVDESTLRQASGYLATSFRVGVDHELRRNLLVGAELGVADNRYEGIARVDDILSGRVSGTWFINRSLRANFGYRFQRRDSTVIRDDYDENVFFFSVLLQH